jgi:hypothetical protein
VFQKNQNEPDPLEAVKYGLEPSEEIASTYNQTPQVRQAKPSFPPFLLPCAIFMGFFFKRTGYTSGDTRYYLEKHQEYHARGGEYRRAQQYGRERHHSVDWEGGRKAGLQIFQQIGF